MEDGHSFGAWLRRRRTQLGLTQDVLARWEQALFGPGGQLRPKLRLIA